MPSPIQTVLAGDVGGTKTLLALAHWDAGQLRIEREARFITGDYTALTPMVREFLDGATPRAACFGLACPISGRRIKLTNREFWIDADEIAHDCGIAHVRLLNDFAAIGYGLDALAAGELEILQSGSIRPQAPRALLGAGTGLGQAILVWQNDRYEVLSTEGGHADFAPMDEIQIELWRALGAQYGHVSYERLLSGQGLHDIFHHLAATRSPTPELLAALQDADPAAIISEFGLSRRDPVAAETLELFARIYGQQAGNLALTTLAEGGVYIAGGIAPKLIQQLKAGGFMQAFRAKGRYREWLSDLRVAVVMNPKAGLLGAALAAGLFEH
ncbi:MAG: glucokinase [Betaproteobacteria bacterium RBG_19FT_COMBO_58_11]|nr:MAG: glucokinase [Betaproteobacteria bacterium RBG_19FT_COMBO_58_11]